MFTNFRRLSNSIGNLNFVGCRTYFFSVKGQEIPLKFGNVRIAKRGQWHLHATDTEPENLDAQVAEILEKLTPDLSVWLDLSNRFEIDLFCGWFMSESNEGVIIAPNTLKQLGERGIQLDIDLYAPSEID
jgi:hypothetical protein